MKVAFTTLGCKVNQYETQVLENLFLKHGFEVVDCSCFSDVYVLNSCTVTASCDSKIRQLAFRFKRINSDAVLVLVGCFAQAFCCGSSAHSSNDDRKYDHDRKETEVLSIFDVVVGNSNKLETPVLVSNFLKNRKKIVEVRGHLKLAKFPDIAISKFKHRFRAFIKIEDGCDRSCAYCIIPKARGFIKSKSLESLKFEVEQLTLNGYTEFVLVGINLSSYGFDFEKKIGLCDAVELISRIDGVKRIRLGSLEPDLLTEADVARLSKIKQFCPNFHLALQSGCDDVLKRMRRRYDTKQYVELVNLIFKFFKNPSITTDLMIGFPQETEFEFVQSLEFVSKIGFLKVHIFPYSKRANTVAALMDGQVAETEKKRRFSRMEKVVKFETEKFLSGQKGKILEVLFEKREAENLYVGHSKNFCLVKVKSSVDLCGRVECVKIEQSFETFCFGRVLK